MKSPRAPRLDERRAPEFSAELEERARAWIPEWGLADRERDFGRALLEIAARFSSEVAERLDNAGEKMRRGFLDWLAVRAIGARPARMPVVFKLADTAQEAVQAPAPVRMQADAAGASVVFETEREVRVVPGRLDLIVGVDADQDAFYLPPPGLSDLKPLESLPTEWRVKNFAAAGATKLQLDPELGLTVGMLVEANGAQYSLREVDNGLVTIDRPLEGELTSAVRIAKVTSFTPFENTAYNAQEHALYLGDSELLNVEAAATFEVVGATGMITGVKWEYWGKIDGDEEVMWQPLKLDDERQAVVNDAVVLKKPKGAIEPREINGRKGRWIRAFTKTITPALTPSITNDEFSIRVNASGCQDKLPCPPDPASESPLAEAVANSTPLALNNLFFPLGKEPRQFDAFYLGSQEAFSKKGANVRLCFELADPTFTSVAVVRAGAFASTVLAGVGKDRALHLLQFSPGAGTLSRFRQRDALRPPIPADQGEAPAQTLPRDLNPACRPVISTSANDFFVNVASGSSIWTWHENAGDQKLSGWKEFTRVPDSPSGPAHIDDIVPVKGVTWAVLSNHQLWIHDNIGWSLRETKDTRPLRPPIKLVALVPVLRPDPNSGWVPDTDMVGVSDDNHLYRVATSGACTQLSPDGEAHAGLVDAGVTTTGDAYPLGAIRPVAYRDANKLVVGAVSTGRNKLLGYVETPAAPPEVIDLPSGDEVIGNGVEITIIGGQPQFSVSCKAATGETYLASWLPFDPSLKAGLFRYTVPESLGRLHGTPLTLPTHMVVPGFRCDLFVARFNPSQRRVLTAKDPEDGAVLPNTDSPYVPDDEFSVINAAGDRILRTVTEDGIARGTEALYPVNQPFGQLAQDPKLLAYRRSGTQPPVPIVDRKHIKLRTNDSETKAEDSLIIKVGTDVEVYKVVDVSGTPKVAQLDRDLPRATGQARYWTPEQPATARVAPIIRLNPGPGQDGDWDISMLDHAMFFFPNADPVEQYAQAFKFTATNRPEVIALRQPWKQSPLPGSKYVLEGAVDEWQYLLTDTSSNPNLSWEYSNGTAWQSLILDEEGTLNLKQTGVVGFKVPGDLKPTDWAGKTNHWIRARLVGGDYGRETVTVKTKPDGNGGTVQTIDRTSEGIRAPLVLKLHISYAVCKEVQPTFVLTQDSGSFRDQSDANRTAGAIVEAFVPLGLMLARISKSIATNEPAQNCSPDCDCQQQHVTEAGIQADSALRSATASPLATGRAIFIGLEATLSEAPINVLLLVDEHNHTEFAPITVETLITDHFEGVVADDATRALGESGLLSMGFAIPPTRSELFGKTRTWLRLTPKASTTGTWIPTIRGAYLNAAWASATETLTRELLGSSNGEPHLTVRLARPPVLRDTLELRVREPLGEEERKALLKENAKGVLNAVDGLQGDWVLWKQVIDPADEPATERVYALDEQSGEIRFGDGVHGRIPPIGRDSIIAFRYCRTEPDPTGSDIVPGNTIAARTALNLISPIETVESVIAADQAAGGAPTESDDRVLRFGFARLRHRSRAVTARDIEDLALQSSPDIVQARAIMGRGYIRLVVVMRGRNPRPSAAQIRELRRLLLDAAPVSLSAPNALRIEGPQIRKLRIGLELQVSTLDHAGALATFVKDRLKGYFDTATGGTDQAGWELGVNPSEEDIAFALIDAPYLESIKNVTLREVADDGKVLSSPETLKASEIVRLADDPIRIEFETAEVMV